MLKSRPKTEVIVTVNDPAVAIDRMTEHDLLEVVEIEEASKLSHWGWDAYHAELQAQLHSIMLVARRPGNPGPGDRSVIGFIVARHIADEIHVNNVAVRPDFRRNGLARRLLRAVLSWGREKGARQAVLEVRAGNVAAQELYGACGFEVIGRRRRYYQAPLEDALLMAVSLERKP
jgi:ribosomal-protein-alanine N-acetyltransferase